MIAMLDAIRRNIKLVSAPLLLLFAVALYSATPWGINTEEHLGLDRLFKWRGHLPPPNAVAIIAISPRNAEAMGLPKKLTDWPRSVHAETVTTLKRLGAKMIAFDVFFQQARNPESDQTFAHALRDAGNVMLFANSRRDMVDYGAARPATLDDIEEPLTLFKEAAAYTAPMLLPKVPARVSRFVIQHPTNPNRFTVPAMLWLTQQPDQTKARQLLKQIAPRLVLNLYGPARTIPTIDLQTLLQHPESVADKIKDAVVFVGFSARYQPEEQDGYYTVFTSEDGLDIAGVELGATAYANLRDQSFLREIPLGYWGAIIWLYGAFVYFFARFLPSTSAAFLLFLIAAALSIADVYLLSRFYLWLPWFIPVVLLTPVSGAFGFWQRSRTLASQHERLQQAFGKYLPASEIKRLAYDGGLPANQEYLNGLCLVTDAEGYTTLSENLSPDTLAMAMEKYYAAIISPIRAAHGLISDVTGDGVIAIWPHVNPEQSEAIIQQVMTAIQTSVAEYNAKYPEFKLPTRLGFHAGKVVLGHF
ncbi:MAG TPA: CHASE2 domain-containing protein, partial [Pseudomonadales bacterium]|nr:CHASE2 domain-containing protein [Pseudomonadales bacterium]